MVNVYIQFKLLYNALYSSRINFGELKLDMRGTEDKWGTRYTTVIASWLDYLGCIMYYDSLQAE